MNYTIEFDDRIINLDNVTMVRKYTDESYSKPWKLQIKFVNGDSYSWDYFSEKERDENYNEFLKIMER